MENEIIQRVAKAIQAELRRQGVLWEDGEDLSRLMMSTGAVADLPAVVRASIAAMREPTTEMLDRGWAAFSPALGEIGGQYAMWDAMIAAASARPDPAE